MNRKENTFHEARFSQSGGRLTIRLREYVVDEIDAVSTIHMERGRNHATGQELLFLKVEAGGGTRAFFVDYEHGQTNVREVTPTLASLSETLAWLLPPGFLLRQGDLAFYRMKQMPQGVQEVSLEQFERLLLPKIGGRHLICAAPTCKFYVREACRFFFYVVEGMQVTHPEHPPAVMKPGPYELAIARGRSLPEYLEIREARTFAVGL
jgi:hypothetical protein